MELNRDEQELHFFGLIRDIRVHGQDLQRSLGEIKLSLDTTDNQTRTTLAKKAVKESRVALERNKKNVYDLLHQIRTVYNTCRYLYNDYGDEVSQVADLWERVIEAWPTEELTPNEISTAIPKIDESLHGIIWHCGFVTIPPRVNEHLFNMRAGQALDFNTNFKDELPDAKDRELMIRFLKDHPLIINGITDTESGIIYCADRNSRVRLMSFVRIGLMLLLGAGLVWLASRAGEIFKLSDWPLKPEQLRALLIAYVFVMLGSFLHIIVAAIKQARAGGSQPFTALEDLVLWVHIKEFPIMAGILSLWFGLFGLAFLGKFKGPDWQTAIFTGYGIDSVVDLVLKRFEAAVPKQAEDSKH